MIKKLIHKVYFALGLFYNYLCRVYWYIRDSIKKPTENTILFVAHPDDDVLFFHEFIKEYKPYVILLTCGWSFRRMHEFKKAMKMYGLKYRSYPLLTRDKRCELLEKYIKNSFKLTDFKICATHNATGEYGHEMHIRVHNAVKNIATCELFVPEVQEKIYNYPLNEEILNEKIHIFKNIYKTQIFVLEDYKQWVQNEKLIKEE